MKCYQEAPDLPQLLLGFVARSMHLRTQKPLFCGWLTYRTILLVVSCPDQFLRLIGPTESRCERSLLLPNFLFSSILLKAQEYFGCGWYVVKPGFTCYYISAQIYLPKYHKGIPKGSYQRDKT